ncbi:MAG: aminotransferase class I/II-fold pyridoxal phosphate-dependent enzyme [bacterium]|nr:aminotransferase class I/II-fold pyridoxal phosphate-dependent enzyme [bacterium]
MNNFITTINDVITDGKNSGILHLNVSNEILEGNMLKINDKELVNFSSCSYLGLEFDPRLKAGAIKALEGYGTQFSASRAYLSSIHYEQLEKKLNALFGGYCVVTPTTTLGHISTIPVIIGEKDAVILDHQVHSSIQTATTLLKPKGIHIELLRHNRMDLLEERIIQLSKKYEKVWYMADGIYSMYGDGSPIDAIYELLDKFPKFHFYVDDAHGMSCFGKNGRGFVLQNHDLHERMVLTTSLNKAFASGGGAMIFPNEKMASLVRTCGGPMITSGPMQPAALGAALAAADIHLSKDIIKMQEDLQENIKYANLMIKKVGLPLIKELNSPVFFIGVCLPKVGYQLIKKMLDDGYYTNLGAFPAVPMKNTGVRFTITRLHTFKQIEGMITSMARHFDEVLLEQNISRDQIYKAFKIDIPGETNNEDTFQPILKPSNLILEKYQTITEIDKTEWNRIFEGKGSFDYIGLLFLEDTFRNNKLAQDNWEFDYLIIRDKNKNVVLATFFTTALCKDDMLSHETISHKIEMIRKTSDPYYLTSKMVMTGSLLTEGNHVFVNEKSSHKKQAFNEMYWMASSLMKKYNASSIMLRDFDDGNAELDKMMLGNGYFKTQMPERNTHSNLGWKTEEEFVSTLSYKSRYHLRSQILKFNPVFECHLISKPTTEQADHWFKLYNEVKNNSFKLNTFDLPKKLFYNIAKSQNWEVLSICLKEEQELKEVAVIFNYKSGDVYNSMFIGIDKTSKFEFSVYRQALYQILVRANSLNCESINLGFTASLEKRRMGAQSFKTVAYMQSNDHFNAAVIESMQISNNQIINVFESENSVN